ncbi:MAG TPA: DUF1634 domain-containing protein [Thermomicrobiales bacterium]|jgi:uncharacterized membrane protein
MKTEVTVTRDDYAERVAELAPIYRSVITVLTWGFRLGAALLIVGLVVAAIKGEPLNRKAERFADVLPAVFDGKASGIVDLAILCLVATPVASVVATALGFFRIGDRRYGTLSLVVLCVLAVSISLSLFR